MEIIDAKIDKILTHLEYYRNLYTLNIFAYEALPDYSPQFAGYMFNVRQKGAAYDVLAKVYMYVMARVPTT